MKRYDKIIGVLAVAALSLFSAYPENTMDRINKDHDHTTSVASRLILADVITSTAFSNASGDISTYASLYIEYEVGVDNQLYYAGVRGNRPSSPSTFNNSWNGIYSSLKNACITIGQYGEGGKDYGNDVTRGVAEVMTAYNCALIASFFGDTPCSQAALVDEKGSSAYTTPKMDTQQEIYTQIVGYLDDTIANPRKEDSVDVTGQDFLCAGDTDKWLKFAYGLKARYATRLTNRSSSESADYEKMLNYVSKSSTSADDRAAFDVYDSNNINPFCGFYNSHVEFGVNIGLDTKLLVRNDPRTSRAFLTPIVDKKCSQVAANDLSLVSVPNGSPDQGTSRYGISVFVYVGTAPTLPMSYHELMSLKAETLHRLSRDAEDALKEAVAASLLNMENSINIAVEELGSGLNTDPSEVITGTSTRKYLDGVVKAKCAANPLQETMTQRYLAMWGASGEATRTYNDFRHMKGLNENSTMLTNPDNSSKFPLRYSYGNSDTTISLGVKVAYGNGDYVYSEPIWQADGSR